MRDDQYGYEISDVVVVAPKALRLFYHPTKGSTETLFYIDFFGASGGTSAQPRRRVVVRDPLLPPQLYLSIRLPRACVCVFVGFLPVSTYITCYATEITITYQKYLD